MVEQHLPNRRPGRADAALGAEAKAGDRALMTLTPVTSSNLAAVGYDPATATLVVRFRSGDVYQYDSVPGSIYRGLMGAASLGGYFAAVIRHFYRYRRL